MLTAKKRACHRVSRLVQGELAKMNNAIDDRRTANRFPIELPIRFETIGRRKSQECGLGQTINISSTEILFTTDQFLNPGYRVKVAIRWPARLGTSVGLQTCGSGTRRLVRTGFGRNRDSAPRVSYLFENYVGSVPQFGDSLDGE